MNSSGSAMAENAKWLDSIEGKTFQLTNAMQALWNSTINSEVIKYFLDIALGATKLVDTIGMIPSALGAALVYFTKFKNYNMGDIFGGMSAQIKGYMQATSKLGILKGANLSSQGTRLDPAAVAAYAQAVQHLNAQKQAQILISNNLNQAQVYEVLIANGVNEAKATEISMNASLTASKKSLTTTTVAEAVATQLSEEAQHEKVVADFLAANGSKKLTAELLSQAVVQGVLTGQQAAAIMSTNALAFSWKSLGAAIKAAFLSNPIGAIITIASTVMMLSPLLDGLFKSTSEKMQDLQTEWQELSDKISSSSKDFKQLKSSADSVIPRFSKLAKGVDKFGKNVNLTDSEYEEFLSLNNQLADMFPEINNGMDAEGNAMLSLSYNANTLEDSLWALVDAKRAAANEEIAATMPDVVANIKDTVDIYKTEDKALKGRIAAYKEAKELLDGWHSDSTRRDYQDIYGDDWMSEWQSAMQLASNEFVPQLQSAFGALDNTEAWNNLVDQFTNIETGEIDWYGILNSADMQNAMAGIEVQIENVQTKIQKQWQKLNPVVTAWANTDYTYQGLDSDLQSAAQAMISNADFSAFTTAEQMQTYIKNSILTPIDKLTPEAKQKLNKLMSIDTDNLNVAEYQQKIKDTADEFASVQKQWSADEILKNTGYQEIIDDIDSVIYKTEQLTDGKIKGEDLLTLDADQISKAFDVAKDYGIKTFEDLQEALNKKTFEVNIDIAAEQEGFDDLQTAIDESTSAAGMSAESIDKIEARYRDLAGYNHAEMFEETAHGIKLNASALRELEKEYNSSNADKLDAQLEDLTDQYNELSAEIATCTDASERANLYRQRQNVLDQINDTATLAAQYRGLASAYNQWQRLKGGSSNKDTYEGVVSGIKDMKEAMSDGWMDEWQKSFVDMFTNSDTSGWSTKQYIDEWTRLRTEVVGAGHTVMDFFTTDDDGNATSKGVYNLLEAIEATMPEVVKFKEETGEKYFDFSGVGDKAVAEAVGISEEVLHILLNAGKSTGIEVHLESAYTSLADFRDEATKVNERLKEIGATDYTFNINSLDINDVEEQIEEAKKALKNLFDENGKLIVDDSDLQNAKTLLATLIYQKQTLEQPAILKVNTENAHSGTEAIIKTLQDFKAAYNELEVKLSVGEDPTEAQAKLDEAISTLQGQAQGSGEEIMAKLGIDLTQSEDDINTALLNITPKIMVEAGLNDQLIVDYQAETHTTEGEFIWNNNAKAVTDWMAEPKIVNGDVIWEDNTDALSTFFTAKGILNLTITGNGVVNGTANALGTAYAGGNWGAPKTETALVGELGPEMV